MTRILHTADVHLSAAQPERSEALSQILRLAEENDIELLTVGGDLFDSEADAEELRVDLRDRLSGLPFSVLAIPGNHDEAAFGDDLFFGEDFRAAVDEPFEYVTIGDREVRLTCLPYTPRPTEELLVDLKSREAFDGTELLLLHCSLEAPFADRTAGDEATYRYFPIGKRTLADLGFDYYLAGHYHSTHRIELPDGGTFVYPGSPASVTRSETKPRSVALLDVDAGTVEFQRLDTFHYDHGDFEVVPGEEERIIQAVESWASERRKRNVDASITVRGHIDMDETSFNAAIDAASGTIPVTDRTTSVGDVLANPLFRSFVEKLGEREIEDDALRDAVKRRTIRVFSELETQGRFR